MSNYPKGFAHGVTIRGVPLQVAHPGKVFWVNNSTVLPEGGIGGSDGNDGTYLRPFSTLDYAIGRCTASRGDIIMVMPGHIEAVTASSITLDVAGVAIIGLGEGDLRPKFNFGATTSTITWSAANCSMKNMVLVATIDSVVAGITLSGAGATIDLETRDTSAAIEFISALVTTADADNLVAKLRHRGFVAGNAMVRYVDLVGCRDADIDIDFFGIASTSVVDMRTTACDNVQVRGRFYNESAALTKNVTNNTTSTWSVIGFDAKAAKNFSGSDDQAVRYTDADLITDDTNNPIGVNDADNAFVSSSVVSNRDGSLLERSEYVIEQMTRGVAVASVDLSAASPRTIYTITGGPVLIHFLGIKITAACSANAALVNFRSTPTVGSPTVISKVACAPDLQSAAAGDWFAIGGGSAEVAIKYATGSVLPDIQSAVSGGIVVDAGIIEVVMSTDNLTTGTATAYMSFTPLSAGVTVA